MKFIRLILFPVSLLYGLGVIIRNKAYDYGFVKSRKFKIPVIAVGNLAVGGAGKSPMTEYLVALLKERYKVATLSRGYGRKTKGFLMVKLQSFSEEVGDEPLQFKQKFQDVTVAVCEDRIEGIKRLNKDHEVIILDDAYQHRAVIPGLSILLFDYTSLFKWQWLLPTGNLREPLTGRKRANLIVITKTPTTLSSDERKKGSGRVNAFADQELFFSYLEYGTLQPINNRGLPRDLNSITSSTQLILITGIANADPLLKELEIYTQHIQHHNYLDHHNFSKENIVKLAISFKDLPGEDKLIITTEKDAQRLRPLTIKKLLKDLPVYYLPVEAKIHEPDKTSFNQLIETYVTKSSVNNRIHKT